MRILFFLLTLCISLNTWSQDSLIMLKAGEDPALLFRHVYRYPGFTEGKVYLKDGDSVKALLNFNLYEADIQFINGKDTMLLAGKETISRVVIAGDTFYYGGGFWVRPIAHYGFASLAVAERLKLHDEQRIGAMGAARPTHNIDSKSSFISWQTLQLQLHRDLIFSREAVYFFMRDNQPQPVNRKNLAKLFSFAGKSSFHNYDKAHHPNLKKEEALMQLFSYMNNLYKGMNR